GAGKTTLFNVIAGYYRPDGGRVVFDGRDVGGRPPHVICRLGLTRTFQLVKPFGNLSVVDNVMIGALTRLRRVSAARLEAERIVVLHHGEAIAEGTPAQVARDRRVIDAYLGDEFVLAQA